MENLNQIFFLKGFVPKDRIKELKKAAKDKGLELIKYVILLMMIILLPY